MTSEEKELARAEALLCGQYGKRPPFRVPEGYFDMFAKRMDALLSKESACQRPKRHSQRWIRLAVAASLVGFVFMGKLFSPFKAANETPSSAYPESGETAATHTSTNSLDQMADYAMLEGEDFYDYLASDNI